ncbi:hypothetical protein VPH35_071748 [Triticum aestivum]
MTADPPTSHVPPNLFHPSPDVLHAGLATEMTLNLWLHGAAARHGTRQYGGQSRDTMPLPPLSVAFSAAPGAQRGGTRHASRIVLDAAAHYPASRLFQRPQVFDVMFGQLNGRLFYKLMIDIGELHILIYRDN